MSTPLALTVLFISVISGMAQGVGWSERDCDFRSLGARRISKFVERAAVLRVSPEYPAEARTRGISGDVWLRLLIDKDGTVVKTCPIHLPGEAKPHRVLIEATEAAAMKWRFKANFGFPLEQNIAFPFTQGEVLFRFRLDDEEVKWIDDPD